MPCKSHHVLRTCGCFPPRRRARRASCQILTQAFYVDAVHIRTHLPLLRTLPASTPCMSCDRMRSQKALGVGTHASLRPHGDHVRTSRLDAVPMRACSAFTEGAGIGSPHKSAHSRGSWAGFPPRRRAYACMRYVHKSHWEWGSVQVRTLTGIMDGLPTSTPCLCVQTVGSHGELGVGIRASLHTYGDHGRASRFDAMSMQAKIFFTEGCTTVRTSCRLEETTRVSPGPLKPQVLDGADVFLRFCLEVLRMIWFELLLKFVAAAVHFSSLESGRFSGSTLR